MEEFSRPATLDDLKTLLRSLNEQGVDYLLIGGYALFAHGYHRATTDIDVLLPATVESGNKVKAALMVLPDQAAREIDPAWFTEGENIRVADAFVVDLMLNANGQTYESLSKYAEVIEFDGIPVQTLDLEGLLLTKQTTREKDIADRIILERALETLRGRSQSTALEASSPKREGKHEKGSDIEL
jgi:predicted nucleotidyltransferase